MKQLKQNNPDIVNFKDELQCIYSLHGYTLKDQGTQLGELEGKVKKA